MSNTIFLILEDDHKENIGEIIFVVLLYFKIKNDLKGKLKQ